MKLGQLAKEYDENQYFRDFSDKEKEAVDFYYAALDHANDFWKSQEGTEKAEALFHYYQGKYSAYSIMADIAENDTDRERFKKKSDKAFEFCHEIFKPVNK